MVTKKDKTAKAIMMVALLGIIISCAFGITTKNADAASKTKNYDRNMITVIARDSVDTTTESGSGGINDFDVTINDDGTLTTSFDDQGDSKATWKKLFDKYKGVILGISGILTLTFVLWFLRDFGKIAANSSNPAGRREAIQGCIFTAIAAAASGIVTVIVGLAWNAFR